MIGRSVIHTLGYLAGFDNAHSQTTDRERTVLREYSSGKRRGVEIGVHEGVTTCLIADAMSDDGTLYAIDPFDGEGLAQWFSTHPPLAERMAELGTRAPVPSA